MHTLTITAQSDNGSGIPGVMNETGAFQDITPSGLAGTGVAVLFASDLDPSAGAPSDTLIVSGPFGGSTFQLTEGSEPAAITTSVNYVSGSIGGFTTYQILTEPTGGVSDVIVFTDTPAASCSPGSSCLHTLIITAQSDNGSGIPGVMNETGAFQDITPSELTGNGVFVGFSSDLDASAVPEPASLILLVTGTLMSGGIIWRQRARLSATNWSTTHSQPET